MAGSDRSGHDASTPHSVRGGRPAPDQGRLWGGRFAAAARRTPWPRCPSRRSSTGAWRRTTCARRWPTPGCCTAPACSPRRAGRHARGAGEAGRRCRGGGVRARAGRRGRALRPGARPRRARRPGAGRQAARRPLAQRPGGDAVPDVAARRRPARRLRRAATSSTPCSPRPRRTRTRRCPAGRICSTPSRCCSPTISPRTRTPLLRDVDRLRDWDRRSRRVALRLGGAGRLVAGARPAGGGRRAGLRRVGARTRSTAPPPATSPPRRRSCSR